MQLYYFVNFGDYINFWLPFLRLWTLTSPFAGFFSSDIDSFGSLN